MKLRMWSRDHTSEPEEQRGIREIEMKQQEIERRLKELAWQVQVLLRGRSA